MKNRIILVLSCICMISLAGLLGLASRAQAGQYSDLTIVMPDGYGFPPLDLREINRISRNGTDVTYDIKKRAAAEAANAGQPVTLVGTNSSYQTVMGLKVREGSFFSEEDWAMRSRYAVLNEPAAYRLFGNRDIIGSRVRIDGESWIVTGIAEDGNKKAPVIYVPASTITGAPDALMVKSEAGMGAVPESLRRLGIYESDSRVIDISAVADLYWQEFCAAIYFGTGIWSLIFAWKRIKRFKEACRKLLLQLQTMYPDELVKNSRKELRHMSCLGLMAMAGTASSLLLAGQILRMALKWADVGKEIKYLSDYFFQGKMQWLMRYLISGPILFSVCIAAISIMTLMRLREERHRLNQTKAITGSVSR